VCLGWLFFQEMYFVLCHLFTVLVFPTGMPTIGHTLVKWQMLSTLEGDYLDLETSWRYWPEMYQ
jgi:hypothetical protein